MKKGLVIYEPKGRALEYAPLALNLYKGCGHGCVYCYAPKASYNVNDFHNPIPRPNIIQRLAKDAPQAAANAPIGDVLLCFTCDPYQPIDTEYQLTRQAIKILHENNLSVTILTKGGKRAERDFDLLTPSESDSFAVTLTFLSEQPSLKWEPRAAIPEERIASLKRAHNLGIKTWVSLEPVIDPDETIEIIKQTHAFVDLYKVGKMNYHSIEESIDWSKFLRNVKTVLEARGCEYYIKKDLRVYGV